MKDQRTGAPVFVKVDEYKEILDVLDMIKGRVREIHGVLDSIKALRSDEDAELAMWNTAVSDIENKIDAIDRIMFEPEQNL